MSDPIQGEAELRSGRRPSAIALAVEKSMEQRGDTATAVKLKILIGALITEIKDTLHKGDAAERVVTLSKAIEPLARSMVVLGGPQEDDHIAAVGEQEAATPKSRR